MIVSVLGLFCLQIVAIILVSQSAKTFGVVSYPDFSREEIGKVCHSQLWELRSCLPFSSPLSLPLLPCIRCSLFQFFIYSISYLV